MASVLSAAPWLVTISRHKRWVFAVSGALIAFNVIYVYRIAPRFQMQGAACSPESPNTCISASRFSRAVLWISAAIYAVGFFSAFLLGPILAQLD